MVELRSPVTQELHLARSGRRPVEEVEDEQHTAAGEQLRQLPLLVRRGPDGCVRCSVPCPQHAGSLLRRGRGSRSSDLCCVGDLADDLDDVAVRIEDAELPVGAVAVFQDLLDPLELAL